MIPKNFYFYLKYYPKLLKLTTKKTYASNELLLEGENIYCEIVVVKEKYDEAERKSYYT